MTSGVDFRRKVLNVKGETMKFNIWDTAGHQDYRMITANFLKGCAAIILVIDAKAEFSPESIEDWMQLIQKYATENPAIVMLCNKSDLLSPDEVEVLNGKVNVVKDMYKLNSAFFVDSQANPDICKDRR